MRHWSRKTLRFLTTALPLLLALSCAKVGAPPGGPEDKTGPYIIESYPVPDEVNVPRRLVARLVFSEPVNRPSVEAALFLSPDPRQRLRYRWDGQALDLIYMDSLVANRTYVISVGSQAKDVRGNPVGESITIAFSTGSVIDRGQISGWLSDIDAPQSVNLWAFVLREDTLPDPTTMEPEYRLQAGADGRFVLAYLKPDRYRVFAVMDRDLNGLWNPQAELLGIPPWDITASEGANPWVSFRLASQDTAPAQVRTAREVNARQVDVRLGRDVSAVHSRFVSPSGDSQEALVAYPDTAGADLWHVFPEQALSAGEWLIHITGEDLFGRPWADVDTLEVRARPDTARPKMLLVDPGARTRVRLVPERMVIEFDEPVRLDSVALDDFRVITADTDTVAVALSIRDLRFLNLQPAEPFEAGGTYRMLLNGSRIRDLEGNAHYDSTVTLPFSVYDPDSLGSLSGELAGARSGSYIYRVLTLRDMEEVAVITAPGPGPFAVDRLPAGKYLLEVIRDDDGSGGYSYGHYQPFQFAEPFVLSPDTITIRARWQFDLRVQWRDNL